MKRSLLNAIAGACLAMSGCECGVSTVPAATERERAALLGTVEALTGTWEMTDETGATQVGSIFAVTSAGTAVREVMFPGSDHEMTNLYHMDGRSLVLTHYCAAGNQPRMRATPGLTPGVIDFTFESVTNLHSARAHYMGQMRLTIVDQDHIRQDWYSFSDGALSGPTTFELKRRK